MKVYLDSDGVFANFDQHSRDHLGHHPDDIGDEKFWPMAKASPDFWETMPPMDGAKEFFDVIKHLSPTVLTGAPKGDFDRAKIAKIKWWADHFGHHDVIVCLSRDKHLYAVDADCLLIDDRKHLVDKFRRVGGQAILHKDFASTLEQLLNMGVL